MKLDCKQAFRNLEGKPLLENEKAVILGPFLAGCVSGGNGQGNREAALQAFDLAVRIQNATELELSGEEQTFILDCVEHDKNIVPWFKGYLRYLIDPETLPKEMRARMDVIYKAEVED